MNLLLHHGVRSALEYSRSGDLAAAHAVRNPEMSLHLTFVDKWPGMNMPPCGWTARRW